MVPAVCCLLGGGVACRVSGRQERSRPGGGAEKASVAHCLGSGAAMGTSKASSLNSALLQLQIGSGFLLWP